MSLDTRLLQTEGIVLRRADCGEADRLLVVFTRSNGKIRALAKGVRKVGSKKVGHLEPFVSSSLMLSTGPSDFWIISQAETTSPRGDMRGSLLRIAYASLVSEIADRITREDGPNSDLFCLLGVTFDRVEREGDPEMAFLFFILQALRLAGFDPQLTSCVKCGKTIQADNHFFAPSDGGVACKECGVHDQYARAITMETLKYLRHIQRTPFNKLKNLVIPPGLAVGLELHTFSLLETLFEGRLKAVDFLRKVRGY